MRAMKDKFPFLALRKPWEGNPNNIWIASTLHLTRNLTRYRFPGRMERDGRQQVRALIAEQLCKARELDEPYFVKAEETGPIEKEFLYEHFLSPHSFQQALTGEGFVLDRNGRLFAMLNMRDHLQLHITETGEELEKSWNLLVKLESEIGKALGFAYSSRYGFLTSNPVDCGTALVVRLYLHVPALIHTHVLDTTLAHLGIDDVEASSIQGGLNEIVGDILVVRNKCTIGMSEENILQMLRTYALKLMVAEKRVRAELRVSRSVEVKDRISRAYGLAIHSYQLETIEAWSALSLLKLGVDLGWVSGADHKVLNELLFTVRRAHLICEYSQEIPQDELAHRRAELVHQTLSHTHLNI